MKEKNPPQNGDKEKDENKSIKSRGSNESYFQDQSRSQLLGALSEKRSRFRQHFRDNLSKRMMVDKVAKAAAIGCLLLAIIPLGSILFEVFKNGIEAISIEFLFEEPGSAGSGRGGIGPAIQGTLILIGLTSLMGVPVGVMSGVYMSEYAQNKLGRSIRFFSDVLMQFPSIVMGVFAFLIIVLTLGHFSIWAGAFALSLIMFPIVARTTEEGLKLVPHSYREAGVALGIKKWVITTKIVIASAKSGLITGIMLAVARIAGETAPLIMTILGSSQFFNSFGEPVDALPLRIWRLSLLPYDSAQVQGWGAALVLILMVLFINVSVRFFLLRKSGSRRRGSKLVSRLVEMGRSKG